jgi:hypothetical protein
MKRRDFLQASAVAGCLATSTSWAANEGDAPAREYFEWRTYLLADPAQQKSVLNYLQQAALPSWGRLGIGPVGVFTETGPTAGSAVHVLIPYKTLDEFAEARQALENDAEYQEAASEYLARDMNDPSYQRIESSLMVAFTGMPNLAVPERKPRVLELREYQSHSEAKAHRKIEMFNNGEIPIFPKVGFENVFYGETLIGPRLPNLKYMLCAESVEAAQANFDKFRVHPDWVAMKDLPEYAETVSGVVQTYLEPTDFSQI